MRPVLLLVVVLTAAPTLVLGAAAQPATVPPAKACGDAAAVDDAARLPCRIETSIFAASEAPSVFSDIKVRSTDLLEASLSVENKGGSLAYAPFLYGLSTYKPLISEMRLRLSQKDNQTTFGVGTQYNPLSPRSGRGKREWNALKGTTPPLETLRLRLSRKRAELEDTLKGLREEFRAASTIQKDMTAAQLEELRQRQGPIADRIVGIQKELLPLSNEIASLEAAEKRAAQTRLQTFYTKLLDSRTPIVGVGYAATTFPLLGGSSKDADKDGLNDVEYRLKKHSINASLDVRLSTRAQLGALVSREWDRGAAEAGTAIADLVGFAVSAGSIVAILDKEYETSDAYRESLFIPSVVLGGAVEYRACTNSDSPGVICPDGLERVVAITPFVDLKVTKTTQFRIGAPFRFTKPVSGTSGVDLGVVTAFTLQLGEPK